MGYLNDTPEMGSGIIYTNPLDNPANTPTAREPTGTPTAPTVANTPGGGGGKQDTGKKGPTFGGGSSVVINRDSPSGYTYVAGVSGRTGQMIRGWLPNDDPRFGNDYSTDYGLVDSLTYDDMIDPGKRYVPQKFEMPSFEMPSFEMPSFQMPEFPKYEIPQAPASPASPVVPASLRATTTSGSDRKNKIRRLTLLTGSAGTGRSTLGSSKGKKTLLGA